MEESKSKKSEHNREKNKNKNVEEKKTKSDTTTSSVTDPSLDSFILVGKGYGRGKSLESGYRLHECYSETAINPALDNSKIFRDIIQGEGVQAAASNSSFTSARSDVSDVFQKRIHDLEDALQKQNLVIKSLRKQINEKEMIDSCVSTTTDLSVGDGSVKLKDLERKLSGKEKEIKDLHQKLQESTRIRECQSEENKGLTNQISLLNRQLQSMFELVGQKNWNARIDPSEFAKYKSKSIELENFVEAQKKEKEELLKKLENLREELESKEMETAAKARELIDYKNQSTLEMCKLINQIDSMQKEAQNHSRYLESKITEAENTMDEEIVTITQKLEEQYRKDVESALEKFHADFERLAELPKTAIEKLLTLSDSNTIDFVAYQKEWDKQQKLLEGKIESLQANHAKEVTQLKDSYESKIVFLKTQVEALVSQLKERKDIIEIFENELMVYKSNSSMNLLKASTFSDDITALKELYSAEIFSQKQVHKLQTNIFEEKVKTLTEEILYHAKNEEIQLRELENAKKLAFAFREKYEQLVFEWEERVEKDAKAIIVETSPELDSVIKEFRNMIESLKKLEQTHEEKIQKLETENENEKFALLRDIKEYKAKLEELEKFQKDQAKLDEVIQDLIKTMSTNYTKTIESLLMSHVTELSLKQMEMCASEKRHIEEIDGLKNDHEKEIEELRVRMEKLEDAKLIAESELETLKKAGDRNEVEDLRKKVQDLSTEYMKSQGVIAMKEETEKALTERIEQLENLMRTKEEHCKKELEDLAAKYLKVEILSSTKDDIAKEVEDKLNESNAMLKRSCRDLEAWLKAGESDTAEFCPDDGGDFKPVLDLRDKYLRTKLNSEQLSQKLAELFDSSEKANQYKRKLEEELEEKTKTLQQFIDSSEQTKQFVRKLEKEIEEKSKSLEQLTESSEQTKQLMRKLKEELEEKSKSLEQLMDSSEQTKQLMRKWEEELEEKSKCLEEKIQAEKDAMSENEQLQKKVEELTERIDALTAEMANNKEMYDEEVVSVSLQEVRFLYEEEKETATVYCQTVWEWENLVKANEELERENDSLRLELRERENQPSEEEELQNIRSELSNVVAERDGLVNILESSKRERYSLRRKLDELQEENQVMRLKYEATVKAFTEKGMRLEEGPSAVNNEIKRLTDYIKALSTRLEVMKANNEILLSESHEHVKHNQSLVNELEEAWSQRYEIEDQLAKVRKENALLNLHRKQLEETNKRISSLVSEGKPSVASWIKIHETVENIVDEVLALKMSFSDSGSVSRASSGFDLPRTNSELKLMTETLHAQLRNKTMLCDELIVQKETLEKELRNLESLLQDDKYCSPPSPSRKRQGRACLSVEPKPLETPYLMTLNKLKKNLESQVEMEEAQFHENLEREIQELKKEMEKPKEEPDETDDDKTKLFSRECLKSIEIQYEEEVMELSREFQRKVEKLKETYCSGKKNDEENSGESYEREIEMLKSYFEKKWADLEERYSKIYLVEHTKKLISSQGPERSHILSQFQELLRDDNEGERNKGQELENFFKDVLLQYENEIQSLQDKYNKIVVLSEKGYESQVAQLQGLLGQLEDKMKSHDESCRIREEYEIKLEEEKRKFADLAEEMKRKHETEISNMEEFWTEKLSECETKCAIMKAERKVQSCGISEENGNQASGRGEKDKGQENLDSENFDPRFGTGDKSDTLCTSCLVERMELKTDDDKLDVSKQREALEEMIGSMRNIIAKLLSLVGQNGWLDPAMNNTTQDIDDTLYKSIHLDLDRTAALDLSSICQEIKDNSLLNSSDQIRVELDKCLKQVTKDADTLFALSRAENISGKNLREILEKTEKEKKKLEEKVLMVEEMQKEMKKEINVTKEKLSQWERNLEVVTEGYGEGIVEPKQLISLSDLKEKLKVFLTENCGQSPQDINLLEEICKEGDRLQREWMKEKFDLQQQIYVADKQLHSMKKFLEEQTTEREQEREAFDIELNKLQESLKAKERDSSIQSRASREVDSLTNQIKDLTARLAETEKNKGVVEGEFQNAVKKIWSLREVIQDLESQLAEVSEKESGLKKKIEKLEGFIEEQLKVNGNLKEELEACRAQYELNYSEHVKSLEEELIRLRHVADQINPDSLSSMKQNLRQIEAVLIKKTKDLEQLHVSSANVSCSSPSEDVSIRDHLDATRCSTPDEMSSGVHSLSMMLPLEEIDRIHEKLARHTRAEEVATKYIQDLKMQLRNHRKVFEEVQTERDVLLEKVDAYLKENSSLKVRLEEQRCNAGLLQRQLNANLESQIQRLEVDVDKLDEMCREKDKQLREMKAMLENTTKSLKMREAEVLNKSKEENVLITSLKTDLANALSDNEKLEEKLEKTREQLRETLKMPALFDSMIEEKNAEIDRLEKEVAKLSFERSTPKSCGEAKPKRKIRFSEPESFSENISSISVHCVSDIRNCSDSTGDFKNFSFKNRRPIGYSTKLDSMSSIAPLQLSPRGADSTDFNWKTSSPIVPPDKSPPRTPTKPDLQQMEEMSKLQGEIESKQREISELHLKIDILKRQLVEMNQEVTTAKSQAKEIQNEVALRDEEIRQLKNNELSLVMTIESLKKNHAEEVEELHNKLNFEHGKVEKVYEEIKTLEVKKIEIEQAFLSLKEDYDKKLNKERKTAETLLTRIRSLEAANVELELKMSSLEKELGNVIIKGSEYTIQTMSKEISDLKAENEKIRSETRTKADAETQYEDESFEEENLNLEITKANEPLKENLEQVKAEFHKMAAVIKERDFNKRKAYSYAMIVRKLLSIVLTRVDELSKEVEAHMKAVMECSVDDLALRVQKELVISAKLDSQLLSSIAATAEHEQLEEEQPQDGGGDRNFLDPKPLGKAAMGKVVALYKNLLQTMRESQREKENLEGKFGNQQKVIELLKENLKKEKDRCADQQKVIDLLKESLKKEKKRILEEKDRCAEDAKIMELLRVNLEKRLSDIKVKERELRKEKQQKMALEKELEAYRKKSGKTAETRKVMELSAQLKAQKEKIVMMSQLLEDEKNKNDEVRMAMEGLETERLMAKSGQQMLKGDLAWVKEQKDTFKRELLRTSEALRCREEEIRHLKRLINVQEIDIRALSLSMDTHNPLDTSSNSGNSFVNQESPASLILRMRRHVREYPRREEALLFSNPEAGLAKVAHEENDTRLEDETLVPDIEVERKLWSLEKGRLLMDLEHLQRENETLKRDLMGTCKKNEALKQENATLKNKCAKMEETTTNTTPGYENGFLQERVSHLTRKYMRAESYRKALAWQKQYLMISLQGYQRSEEEAWKKLGRKKRDGKPKGPNPCGKFRAVALAAMAIFRMKFIVKRWQRNAISHVFTMLETQAKTKLAPLTSVLGLYNEPVNPLSYQTQNIFHSSTTQVMRTPPSRDPGLQSNSPKQRTAFESLKENLRELRTSP